MSQPTLVQFTSDQMEQRLRVQFISVLSVFFLVLFISFHNYNGLEVNCPQSLFYLVPQEKSLRGDGEQSESREEVNYNVMRTLRRLQVPQVDLKLCWRKTFWEQLATTGDSTSQFGGGAAEQWGSNVQVKTDWILHKLFLLNTWLEGLAQPNQRG